MPYLSLTVFLHNLRTHKPDEHELQLKTLNPQCINIKADVTNACVFAVSLHSVSMETLVCIGTVMVWEESNANSTNSILAMHK